MSNSQYCLVVTQVPVTGNVAESLTEAVLRARLAACVNQLAPCHSHYWWEGALCQAEEIPLLMKTTQAQYAALEALIKSLHPYQTPEIIALPISAGLPSYLAWVGTETSHTEAPNTI